MSTYVCPLTYILLKARVSNPAIENMNLALGYSEYEGIPLDGSS